MKIKPRRRSYRLGPVRINRAGLRLTSITVDLGVWSAVLYQAPRRATGGRS